MMEQQCYKAVSLAFICQSWEKNSYTCPKNNFGLAFKPHKSDFLKPEPGDSNAPLRKRLGGVGEMGG